MLGTVRAELAFPLENAGLSAAAVARGVEEAALALGIAELLDRSTHELTGGELQRVALGAALATAAARSSCSTSRPPSSTPSPATSCSASCAASTRSGGPPSCSPSTASSAACPPPTASSPCATAHITCDADPAGVPRLGRRPDPGLLTPGARLFSLAGLAPLPVSVKDARATLSAVSPGTRDESRQSHGMRRTPLRFGA